jgi:hypothetical protein
MAVSASKWGNELKILLPTFVKRSGYSRQTKCIRAAQLLRAYGEIPFPTVSEKRKGASWPTIRKSCGKRNLRIAQSSPDYALQDGQAGQDSEPSNRHRMAISEGRNPAMDG